MNLVDVYSCDAVGLLYKLLGEREPQQCISHKAMPTMDQHIAFFRSRPYIAWYLIEAGEGCIVGAAYLTHAREIGIFIFKDNQGKGYGSKAVAMLLERHPGRILANINPRNEASLRLFKKLGFTHIQETYANE